MSDSELCFMPAVELRARLLRRAVSAREVMQAHLRQIERVNPALNAIVTLAAAGVADFRKLQTAFSAAAPLRRNVSTADVGNAAVYLCSPLAAAVTGEVHYVDAGFNIIGVAAPSE